VLEESRTARHELVQEEQVGEGKPGAVERASGREENQKLVAFAPERKTKERGRLSDAREDEIETGPLGLERDRSAGRTKSRGAGQVGTEHQVHE
jgi:hypothetical protein